jgi:3-hydroxyacyl-CoA dehydrogenase
MPACRWCCSTSCRGASGPNAPRRGGVERLLKSRPGAVHAPRERAARHAGNIEDDLPRLAECDWIVEAVIEDLDVKQRALRQARAARKAGRRSSPPTPRPSRSRSSSEGMPRGFRRDFLVTHFFNPPRYMRLLELVAGPETRRTRSAAIRHSPTCARQGRGRLQGHAGLHRQPHRRLWIQAAVNEAVDGGLTVEEADAVMGRPFGVPKTGIFGLHRPGRPRPHAACRARASAPTLPPDDPYPRAHRDSPLLPDDDRRGLYRPQGQGRLLSPQPRDGGRASRRRSTSRPANTRHAERPRLDSVAPAKRSCARCSPIPTRAAAMPGACWPRRSSYAAALVPEIADDIVAVDEAMRLGYAWKWGPFELIDRLGAHGFAERARAEGGRCRRCSSGGAGSASTASKAAGAASAPTGPTPT